jgi:hypothetical protein
MLLEELSSEQKLQHPWNKLLIFNKASKFVNKMGSMAGELFHFYSISVKIHKSNIFWYVNQVVFTCAILYTDFAKRLLNIFDIKPTVRLIQFYRFC